MADTSSQDPDAYVAQHWPALPASQQRSLATWIHAGWAVADIGRDGEVNLIRGNGMAAERGYIRADGVFRPA